MVWLYVMHYVLDVDKRLKQNNISSLSVSMQKEYGGLRDS